MYSCAGLAEARGCPIRIFTDQSLFATPRNFSQRTTSFIASQCQGIHQMPLSRLIALIINAHPWGVGSRQEIQQDGHRQKNLLCFDLPVVGGQTPQPRLAANYKQIPSFTMSLSDTHAFWAAKLVCRSTGRMPEFIMDSSGMWWSQTGSNRRPEACKATALPTELWPRPSYPPGPSNLPGQYMVGLGRVELPTSRLSSARSNQLSYRPESTRSIMRPERKRNVDGGVPQIGT